MYYYFFEDKLNVKTRSECQISYNEFLKNISDFEEVVKNEKNDDIYPRMNVYETDVPGNNTPLKVYVKKK